VTVPRHAQYLFWTGCLIPKERTRYAILNRDADWPTALVLGAVVSARHLCGDVVQDRHSRALDLTEKAANAGDDLLLSANSAMVLKDVGLKERKYTGEITSGQASRGDHPLTEIFPKENPSSPMEAAEWVPAPVLAITSELNHINAQTNRSAPSPVIWQDSARLIRPKVQKVLDGLV
jgi:hypothetical protein